MTDRHTVDTLTSDQLDALYDQLERAQRVAMHVLDQPIPDETTPSRRAGLRDEIANALEAADYSGNMRRGDLADSVMPVLYREWPWLRAEAEEVALDPELRRQRNALIKALGASETENADLRRALIHCPHKETLARVRALAVQHPVHIDTALLHAALDGPGPAETDTESTVTRVISLYEQWVKAGAPPLGVSMSRWWDARLVELHTAILPPADQTTEQ